MTTGAHYGMQGPRGPLLRIEGAATTNKLLKQFEFKIRRNIVQAAVRAGCAEIRKEARARAPYRTGTLRKQLTTSVKTDKVDGRVTGTVKAKRSKAQRGKGLGHSGRYLHLVVGGTRPHTIEPSQAAAISFGPAVVTRVEHPGARAQPFMESAANASMQRAITAFTMKMDERILKEAAKLRARSDTK